MFDSSNAPTLRRQQRGPALALALAGLFVAGSLQAQIAVRLKGWDTSKVQSLTYHIDVDMDCDVDDPTLFHEHDVRKLYVNLGAGKAELTRTSSIEASSEHFGPYGFAADGSLSLLADDPNEPDDQKTPPMEAVLLLRVWAGLPVNLAGNSWSYLDPATNQISQDKIEVQQLSSFHHLRTQLVGGMTQYTISLDSYLKLYDNMALSALIGDPADRSPVAAQAVTSLSQDGNLFLFGTLVWETANGADLGKTAAADLTYIALPFSGGTQDSIANSIYRQRFAATLLP